MNIASNLIMYTGAYLYFCFLAIDPQRRATYWIGNPMFGIRTSQQGIDRSYKFFGAGALLWTAILFVLEKYNSTYCSMTPATLCSAQTLFSFLTVTIAAKIIFGPVLEIRKSLRIVGEQQFTQPLLFQVYDAVRIWPENFTTKISWKVVALAVVAPIMWGLQKIVVLNNEMILRPIILVWILACFGKTATIIVYQRPPYSLQILFYLASVVGIAIIWTLMDRMLKGCGLEQDGLPSLGALVGGVIGLPLTEVLAAVLGSIF